MNNLAFAIAKTILNGFERHIFLFSELTRSAKYRFEQCLWADVQQAARERTDYYDIRVTETLKTLRNDFTIGELNEQLWCEIKRVYVELLKHHDQPELAESFYNSIFCHLFARKYYLNTYIFVESCTEQHEKIHQAQIYTRYNPAEKGLYETIEEILTKPNFAIPYVNLKRDINRLIRAFRQQADKTRYQLDELHFEMLDHVFYRNKGAYIIGRVKSPAGDTPFLVALLNNEQGGLYIDALITDDDQMAVVFGFARAYFFVDCQHPFALVQFLGGLIPQKTAAEL